jgi:hypothetical protein
LIPPDSGELRALNDGELLDDYRYGWVNRYV